MRTKINFSLFMTLTNVKNYSNQDLCPCFFTTRLSCLFSWLYLNFFTLQTLELSIEVILKGMYQRSSTAQDWKCFFEKHMCEFIMLCIFVLTLSLSLERSFRELFRSLDVLKLKENENQWPRVWKWEEMVMCTVAFIIMIFHKKILISFYDYRV